MKVQILGIDLAKNVFQLHGVDRRGREVMTRLLRRDQLMVVLGEFEPCLIGSEASTGAFYWQRQFDKLGHTMKIMAPQYVKPFVRRQKNDSYDAEAICTAAQQRNMRFVPKAHSNSYFYNGPRGQPLVEESVSGFPIWAHHRLATPYRCLQSITSDRSQDLLETRGRP
jgi:hypothetical protein